MRNGSALRSLAASLELPAQWRALPNGSGWKDQTLKLSVEPRRSPPVFGAYASQGENEIGDFELMRSAHTSVEIWLPETLCAGPILASASLSCPGADRPKVAMGSSISLPSITCSSSTVLMRFGGKHDLGWRSQHRSRSPERVSGPPVIRKGTTTVRLRGTPFDVFGDLRHAYGDVGPLLRQRNHRGATAYLASAH